MLDRVYPEENIFYIVYEDKTSNGTIKTKIAKTKSFKTAYVELNKRTSFSRKNGFGHSNWYINPRPLTLGNRTT
jgi:hypothetical protein